MEYVSFILKFIPCSYIKTLLEIVVKLKIKKKKNAGLTFQESKWTNQLRTDLSWK